MPGKSERRLRDRKLCSELVEVSFDDQRGWRVSETGLLEDVAARGLCVSLSIPIPQGWPVRIRGEGFRGEGTVRYCNLGDYGYLLGLEFASGQEWNPEKWRPKYLLELPVREG